MHQSAYALANHWVAKVALLCSTFCMSSPTISHASNTVVNLVAQVSQMVADRPTGNTPKTSNRQKPYQKAKAICSTGAEHEMQLQYTSQASLLQTS